jgi:MFS transporter, OFA family, oxalate/formate antiporter
MRASSAATLGSEVAASSTTRWTQLGVGIVCMVLIANLQYSWTLFVNPINKVHGWSIAEIQLAFSIFIALETWLTPVEGWIVDAIGARNGPRLMVAFGGIMVALGWIVNAYAQSLTALYAGSVIAGVGGGAIYATCVGQAVKWFPDRRGLAVGLTAAGYGAGAAISVVPIREVIASSGYEAAFLWFGIVQGGVVFLVAWLMRAPEAGELAGTAAPKVAQSARSYSPLEVLASPVFWLLYVMFVTVSASGLMATAQLAPIAKDFKIGDVPVSILGLTLPALTFALSIDRVLNGLTRPFFGWVSDHIGRENTMFIAFSLEAVGIFLLSQFGQDPFWFVILTGIVFFGWGEIYSLFPSTVGDSYGSKFAATNAGLLYTAKGTASLLVPFTSVITAATGGWHLVFYIAAAMNAVAAVMALALLKPMRARQARADAGVAERAPVAPLRGDAKLA